MAFLATELNAAVLRACQVLYCMFGSLQMLLGNFGLVLCKEICNSGKIGACGVGYPVKGANDGSIFGFKEFAFNRIRWWSIIYCINGQAGAIRCTRMGDRVYFKFCKFNEIISKGFLAEFAGEIAIIMADPLKFNS